MGASRVLAAESGDRGRGATWRFLTSPNDWAGRELRRDWEYLVANSTHLRQIYQTPCWFDHLTATGDALGMTVAVTRDPEGRIRALVPLRILPGSLDFELAGQNLGRFRLRTAQILGGLGTVPEDRLLFDNLFEEITRSLPHCDAIRLSGVTVGSFLWQYLRSADPVRDRYLLHVIEPVSPYHILLLPSTFAEYLGSYNAKKRYNLRRQARILKEHGGGRLELRRIDSPSKVESLFEAEARMIPDGTQGPSAGGIRRNGTWSREEVLDLAGRGLLRSYVLTCGDVPVSLINGLQYGKTYSVLETMYNETYASLSPGATTLYLAVEDLLTNRPVELIDFGFGDPSHRHHASNITLRMTSVLLLKKTVGNRVRRASHRAFNSTVSLAKRIRGRISDG